MVDLPCQTEIEIKTYREPLQQLVIDKTGQPAKDLAIDPNPPWLNSNVIPDAVCSKAQESQVNLSLQQWSDFSPAQRFALIKLSRPSQENKNFIPALQEFGII